MRLNFDSVNLNHNQQIALLVIFIFTILLTFYFIHISLINRKNKRYLHSFTSGKNNLRLFTINFKDETVYVVDKKNFKGKKKESYRWFFNSFTKEDSIRVRVWLNELIKKDRSVQNNLEVHVLLNGKTPVFSVLNCTGIDYDNHIIHIESRLFPEIKNRRFNYHYKDEKINTYNELAQKYQASKNEKSNIYLIRIFPSDFSNDKKGIWINKILITLLMSRIKKFLGGSMRMGVSKNNELIVLENHIGSKNKTISYGHKFASEVSKLIHLNSLQGTYLYKVGIATGQAKNQTFDELVKFARKMTIESQVSDNHNVVYNSNYSSNEVKQEIIDLIKTVIEKQNVDVTYTPLFNCINGHLQGFYSQIKIENNLFPNYIEMEDYAYSYSLIDELLSLIYQEINSVYINKYFISTETRRLFMKIKIQYYNSVISLVEKIKVPSNVKTIFVLNDNDIYKEAISNNKFLIDALKTLKDNPNIRLGLEFTSTSLELSDELLKSFDYFIFNYSEHFPNLLSSTQDQILFQNLVNNLKENPKGKLTAVNLKSWQAIEYFSSLGFKYVSASYFGSEVNKLPQIDTKKVNKLLSLID